MHPALRSTLSAAELLGLLLLLLTGCAKQETLAERAAAIVKVLSARQLEPLATYVHPQKGVRFSPAAYIDPQADRVLAAGQLAAAWTDNTAYRWGVDDATGEPIKLSFRDYFASFVYDADYAQAEKVAYDEVIGSSTTVNNLTKVYPDARFVEYHFSGFDPQFEGMDWKSLRLVFEQLEGVWYLVGIVHDQWSS